jgi:hypothetical protein
VLTMHIMATEDDDPEIPQLRAGLRERGPGNVISPSFAWFKINKLENWYESEAARDAILADAESYFRDVYTTQEGGLVAENYGGEVYLLGWIAPDMSMGRSETEWRVTGAGVTQDDLGRPAVRFDLDPVGARLMADMSERNVNLHGDLLLRVRRVAVISLLFNAILILGAMSLASGVHAAGHRGRHPDVRHGGGRERADLRAHPRGAAQGAGPAAAGEARLPEGAEPRSSTAT